MPLPKIIFKGKLRAARKRAWRTIRGKPISQREKERELTARSKSMMAYLGEAGNHPSEVIEIRTLRTKENRDYLDWSSLNPDRELLRVEFQRMFEEEPEKLVSEFHKMKDHRLADIVYNLAEKTGIKIEPSGKITRSKDLEEIIFDPSEHGTEAWRKEMAFIREKIKILRRIRKGHEMMAEFANEFYYFLKHKKNTGNPNEREKAARLLRRISRIPVESDEIEQMSRILRGLEQELRRNSLESV